MCNLYVCLSSLAEANLEVISLTTHGDLKGTSSTDCRQQNMIFFSFLFFFLTRPQLFLFPPLFFFSSIAVNRT